VEPFTGDHAEAETRDKHQQEINHLAPHPRRDTLSGGKQPLSCHCLSIHPMHLPRLAQTFAGGVFFAVSERDGIENKNILFRACQPAD
jgi:hypothetical protein